MSVSLKHFKEASGHITTASGQQDRSLRISKLALKVLNGWTSLTCHHHLSKSYPQAKPQKTQQP
jgi:hypothetical protein